MPMVNDLINHAQILGLEEFLGWLRHQCAGRVAHPDRAWDVCACRPSPRARCISSSGLFLSFIL